MISNYCQQEVVNSALLFLHFTILKKKSKEHNFFLLGVVGGCQGITMTLLLLKNIIFTFYFYSSTLVKAKAMHNCEAQSHVKEPLVNTINKFSFLTYLCHLLFLTSKPGAVLFYMLFDRMPWWQVFGYRTSLPLY